MAKRGFLTKDEKEQILTAFVEENQTIAEIAAALDRSEKSVASYLESLKSVAEAETEPVAAKTSKADEVEAAMHQIDPTAPPMTREEKIAAERAKQKARPDSLQGRRGNNSGRSGTMVANQLSAENVDSVAAALARRGQPVSKGAFKIYKD